MRVSDFRAQLAYLQRHYRVVDLQTGLAELEQSRPAKGKPLAVITFDDGDVGLFKHLPALLDEAPVPVTIYIATDQIVTGHPYWFDRVMNALEAPYHMTLSLEDLGQWQFGSETGAARWRLLGALLEALKTLSPELRELRTQEIVAQATAQKPEGWSTGKRVVLGPLSVTQIQALAAHPCVTIGAHSHCHNLLDQISVAQARSSIETSGRLLRDWTGKPVAHFAYPNGNHSSELLNAVRDAGFLSAVALDDGLARPGSDVFALPRIGVGRDDPLWRIKLRLAGI
jgi:peptidoglycan/xylan/chitin deacetylase (PgdA/CDA1 family)